MSSTQPATPTVTVRYFAGARAAVGVDTETREAGSLEELVGQLVDAHGDRLERVLTACSFLVDGTTTRDRALVLAPGAVVDVLPPFAGG
ncbi:MoaD/ThiS family protein [Modestobacter versicolor]|uniref:MoaD/ThiS family protein n=1 Tax=Modestobacter versicolor TaxID=429133 RepID=A0A323VES9_9ACTN|nr:MoaD/ThiS family protein [Modestobacter versicolor]MBB3677488.1 molybdopterin converting factor small subunit [Modestobacter versicolor]PZA22573.1 MoaD/ThiS family protein [Modestobacter versicolor]